MLKFMYRNFNTMAMLASIVTGIASIFGYEPNKINSRVEPVLGDVDKIEPEEQTPQVQSTETRHPRSKPYDTTPFNQHHFDTIMKAHHTRIEHNQSVAAGFETTRISVKDITNFLNTEMSLNKSRQSYALIWCGHIKRDELEPASVEQE